MLDADHLCRALEHRAAALGAAGQRHDDAGRLGESVRLHIQPAEDPVGVKQRMQLDAFLRVDDPACDTPRGGPTLPAVQFGQSRLGRGDLQPADLVEAPLPVDLKGEELLDCVGRERSHRLRRGGLKHQAWRV